MAESVSRKRVWHNCPSSTTIRLILRPHVFVIFWSVAAAVHTWWRKRWL